VPLIDYKKTALIYNDKEINYKELLQNVSLSCSYFLQGKYHHIVICSENRSEWIYNFFAGWKIGAVIVPVDFMSSVSDIEYIINDCQPELVIYSDTTKDAVLEACKNQQHDIEQLNMDHPGRPLDAIDSSDSIYPVLPPEKTALLIYTSGTTGSPKGVMLSFDNLYANYEAVSDEIPIFTSSDSVMVLLPLHHIFPLMGTMIAPLFSGSTIVFSPSLSSDDMMMTLEKYSITIIIGVPRLYSLISKSIMAKIKVNAVARTLFRLASMINSLAFSRKLFGKVQKKFGGEIRFLVSGGAKLDEDTGRNLRVLGFEVLEGFGMTEAAPMITFTRPGEVIIGSAGKPLSCNKVIIKDGEIVTRGRNVMQGYYNRPEETAEVLKDGWLCTGDLGWLDKNDNIFITGRRKEIIVLPSGKNISPVEIEHKLQKLSDLINEVGVFLKDDILQVIIFPDFVKLRQMQIVNIEEYFRNCLIEPYNQKATPYKKLLKLHIIKEELPKTRLGKLKRFLLDDLMASSAEKHKEVPIPDSEEYTLINKFLADQKDCQIYPNDHLELDLGLDSLDRIGFQTFLNSTFGVDVTEDIMSKYPTVAAIANYIKETKQHIKVSVVEWSEILKEQIDHKLPESWFLHNPIKNISRWIFKFYFKLSAKGMEKLPQAPFIIASNHQSYFDGLFIASFLKNRINKETYFFAKAKHLQKGWLKFLAKKNNVIVVDIDRDLKQSIQQLSAVLKNGKNIIIFPEGTRTRDGKVGTFKKTFSILSKELNVPVVPVAINGAYDALPSGNILPKPLKSIEIKFLDPVWPEDQSYEVINSKVREYVTSAIG